MPDPAPCEKDGPFALATAHPDGRVSLEGIRGADESWRRPASAHNLTRT